MTVALLEVRDLCVRYPRERNGFRTRSTLAVAGVSFSLAPGESLGLVGESGSGKSSIAHALLRLVKASGNAHFQGVDLLRLSNSALRATREHLQIVFQNPLGALDPRMPVAALVAEPLWEFRASLTRAAQRAQVTSMLSQVGLGPEFHERYPQQLSGGQAQRVSIARALVLRPKLLICDEPVAALDVSIRSQIANLLRDMRDELRLSMLFIAHDLATVRYICDRVMVLYLGRVMEIAPRDALYSTPQHPYTRALLAANPVPDPARAQPIAAARHECGAKPNTAVGCAFYPHCSVSITRCSRETPALRQIGAHQIACHRAGEY